MDADGEVERSDPVLALHRGVEIEGNEKKDLSKSVLCLFSPYV